MTADQTPLTYQCPGEVYTITRAVHLGRLASFYPKCRQCPHREDTGPLSPRTVSLLQETRRARPAPALFGDEGVRGVHPNELDRRTARRIAEAFAALLGQQRLRDFASSSAAPLRSRAGSESAASSGRAAGSQPVQAVGGLTSRPRAKAGDVVVVGHDERLSSPDLAGGAIAGLRAAGSVVVEVGCVSGPCLRHAVRYLDARGGLMITGGNGPRHVSGIAFYGEMGLPLCRGNGLEKIEGLWSAGTSQRVRRAGPLQRFDATVPYLASLLKHFHALRPLRVMVRTESATLRQYLLRLFENAACRAVWPKPGTRLAGQATAIRARGQAAATARRLPGPSLPTGLSAQGGDDSPPSVSAPWPAVHEAAADLGVSIDEDDQAVFYDEQGRLVAPETTARLLYDRLRSVQSEGPVVLAEDCLQPLREDLGRAAARVILCPPTSAAIWEAMTQNAAVCGAARAAQFWFYDAVPEADPLLALAGMLAILSRADLRLSEVIERHIGGAGQPSRTPNMPGRRLIRIDGPHHAPSWWRHQA